MQRKHISNLVNVNEQSDILQLHQAVRCLDRFFIGIAPSRATCLGSSHHNLTSFNCAHACVT